MDYEARKVIEALRSGVPSRTIGGYFGSARAELLAELSGFLDIIPGEGKIILGSYGEGKTHLLNTISNIAHNKNMAVSMVTLSREIPFNNLPLVYKRITQNTFLPGRAQPGFDHLIEKLNSADMAELLLYTGKNLLTDKLYYLLKAFRGTDDPEMRFMLMADLHGDFIANSTLKKYFKDIFAEKITYSTNFIKNRHIWDYFMMLEKLFILSGLHGWIILFDEAENIGRLGRKSRFNAYTNMSKLLHPEASNMYSLFTMTNNYITQVIEGKDERRYLEETEGFDRGLIESALIRIETAPELTPLNKEEFSTVLEKIVDFHVRAYKWQANVNKVELCEMAWSRGYYLRTKIRAAIEYLDQYMLYGDAGIITAEELEEETYDDLIPLPEDL